jgi:hypothetical protein
MNSKISLKVIVRIVIILVIIILAITSCKKDDKGKSKVNIYLTDAPALYSSFNVEITSVNILTENSKQEKVFKTVYPGDYDLFKLSNGGDTLIATTEISPIKILDIRIIFGANNYVLENDVKKSLITDLSKSLVCFPNVKPTKDETLNLWIDIDAFRSIKKKNDGSLVFNPVFRVFEKKKTGTIRGIALPANARSFISAYNQTDTFCSVANENGLFTIQGVKPGKYVLKFTPQLENFLEAVLEDSVVVEAESSPYVGTIALN